MQSPCPTSLTHWDTECLICGHWSAKTCVFGKGGGGGQGFNRLRADTDYLIFAPHLDTEALNDEFCSKNIEW